ncbi:MAG: hypothetical protein PHO63_02030 [Bacilli bacterium]|nr:hypothetical protein [Bacilli bacterium]MDD4809251.1 hypothetical protein [Bacilli bacterium]
MKKEYIILMGAGFSNKGAQSMVFTVTSDLIKKYSNKKIVMLSSIDYNRDKYDKEQYKIIIEKHPKLTTTFYLSDGLYGLADTFNITYDKEEKNEQSCIYHWYYRTRWFILGRTSIGKRL